MTMGKVRDEKVGKKPFLIMFGSNDNTNTYVTKVIASNRYTIQTSYALKATKYATRTRLEGAVKIAMVGTNITSTVLMTKAR